ncbi:phytanoyl-CoA dioxygenase family protein [Fulvivirga ligni]|uniref:phytanoyl-CoA dioxygenase family protein n=1 Tax=Fulvivirga ligni TaxID=2904246 RepID=UPI001F37C884|nr:phytanoyl-CoA dioxygenase family protein [Fulvivirga ligni]UII23211.1 phytanoyl-CoA dioxygenase family protein [Fulvivirga ligni]
MNFKENANQLKELGYSITTAIYSEDEIRSILACLKSAEHNSSFMKTKDLFAIRQLFTNVSGLKELVLNENLCQLISDVADNNYFISKAIYFDKPSDSNWFVAYHQDLSISVNQRAELDGYCNWTFKKGQHGVQPPLPVLEDTITIRIHLDDTDENNGALKVISGSHKRGVIRIENKDWNSLDERLCNVQKGGVMLMKPLTLHASGRTTNQKRRRVIHIELNKHHLESPLEWLEKCAI